MFQVDRHAPPERLASGPTCVHGPPDPAADRSKRTTSIPEPPSVAGAASCTAPIRYGPGSVKDAVGAVLSMRRPPICDVSWLPARSVAVSRNA